MRTSINLFFLGLVTLFLAACGNAPAGEKVESGEAMDAAETPAAAASVVYAVNTAESQVNWVGGKLVGNDQHTGFLKLSNGSLSLEDGNLVAGKFAIDMNSLTNTDMGAGDGKEKLEGHLKSGDFFDVGNHPEGSFEIVAVEAVSGQEGITHNITGNLTLKGIAKSITIPASVKISENELVASTPDFNINRTEWGVKYGSGLLGIAQDKIIKDEVGLQINLKAAPQAN